ncbi:hypothetical protein SKAU_G00026570 [Synaphobranchus kaupii]|uniref:K Homology domain-containing protein n=1 Tax=Synaphobranchus kaupii TaxID=118154 RepID=A0A9Q1GE73_SYNKA|nr:hypothetical protein SKAU_G00026570 [Synaphobranchus kaupii]
MEQFHTEHFFGPGCTCFYPHECNNNIFIPPGYNGSPTPFHMQHHWNHFSTDQYNLAPSSMPDHSPTDLETNMTDYCLSNSNAETENCESGLALQHNQVMPTTKEEQQDIIVEIMHVSNMTSLAGEFIGEEGQYLKFVNQRCGGLVYMSTHPRTQDYVVCNIMGTKHQVYKALDLIRKKVKCQGLKNIYSPPTVTFGGHLNETQTPKKYQNRCMVSQVKPV